MDTNKTLLIVDDEVAITDAAYQILRDFGYKVFTASNPSAALKIVEEHGDSIDLLITDIIMPEMNGDELSKKISLVYPDMKTLFISGYYSDILSGQAEEYFLKKPFRMSQLANKVKTILNC